MDWMRSTAATFLRNFRDAAARGDAFEAIAADAPGFAAAIDLGPDALGATMTAAADGAGGTATVAPDAFSTAACTADGTILAASPGFAAWRLDGDALARTIAAGVGPQPRLSAIVDDATGLPVAVAVAAAARARGWPLDATVRAALDARESSFGVIG